MTAARHVLVVDSREQAPLPLFPLIERHRLPFILERGVLPTADYAMRGYEADVLIERKSLADLVGCIGHGRERFERELVRLSAETTAPFLLIEATASEVLLAQHRGHRITPQHLFGSLAAWSLDHRLRVVWTGDREASAQFVLRLFGAVLRRRERSTAVRAG